MKMMNKIKYFIIGLIFGFLTGFTLMNMPNIMRNSGTYVRLQRQQEIERRK